MISKMRKNKEVIIGATLVGLSSILWSFDGVVLTPRLGNLNIGFVVFMLHLFPFILMNFFLYKKYKLLKTLDNSEWFSLFAVAVFGGAVGTMAIVKALFLVNFNSLSIVVLLQKLQPIFAILLASTYLKEKPSKNFLKWASVAVFFGYFLTFGLNLPDFHQDKNIVMVAFYSILAAFSFGSSTVFSKRLLEKVDFVSASFFRYGLVTLMMFVYVLASGHLFDFGLVTKMNWTVLAITTVTTGSGAIFLYYYGLTKVKAIISTIAELFFPISAVLFDYLFNGVVLSPIQWISAGVMIFAIINLNLDNSRRKVVRTAAEA